jgi:hypothetical protein
MSRGQVKSDGTDKRVKHGHACRGKITPEFRAYLAAMNRCNNTKSDSYRFYGGRGIKFRFKSFLEFLHEVGERPSTRHSLDRIKNNGDYKKRNVRWSLSSVQNKNKRKYACLQGFSTKELIGELKRRNKWPLSLS